MRQRRGKGRISSGVAADAPSAEDCTGFMLFSVHCATNKEALHLILAPT